MCWGLHVNLQCLTVHHISQLHSRGEVVLLSPQLPAKAFSRQAPRGHPPTHLPLHLAAYGLFGCRLRIMMAVPRAPKDPACSGLTYSSSRLRMWSIASSTFSGSPVTVTQLGSGAPLCGKRMSTWKKHRVRGH